MNDLSNNIANSHDIETFCMITCSICNQQYAYFTKNMTTDKVESCPFCGDKKDKD